ncbi:MAG: PilN domain-containing protein [bacterium]|nr:PilN domain-containing protein [bacterium]
MTELIPKQAPEIPKWLNVLFYFSLALLALTIASFFILNSSVNNRQEILEDLNQILLSKKTPERMAMEEEILNYEKKLKDFSFLAEGHSEISGLYLLIEESTHPQVWFSQFTLDAEENMVSISGKAQNFEVLGQQMLILGEKDFVRNLYLDSAGINKQGKVDFALTFNPSLR